MQTAGSNDEPELPKEPARTQKFSEHVESDDGGVSPRCAGDDTAASHDGSGSDASSDTDIDDADAEYEAAHSLEVAELPKVARDRSKSFGFALGDGSQDEVEGKKKKVRKPPQAASTSLTVDSEEEDAVPMRRVPIEAGVVRVTSMMISEVCKDEDLPAKVEAAEGQAVSPTAAVTPEAGGTGADRDSSPEKDVAAADTGGTPPEQPDNPLKGLLTAKKVDAAQLRKLLESLPDAERWVNATLSSTPPLPSPLFFAIGATLPAVVSMLVDYNADVKRPFDGEKMYNGWIKPEMTPIEAVTNRKGRFLGTMLGDRLEEILVILKKAEARPEHVAGIVETPPEVADEDAEQKAKDAKKGAYGATRKSVKMVSAIGTTEHTQGNPDDKYDVISDLGEGCFCTVQLGQNLRTGEKRAIKAEMKIEEAGIWEEITIMRKLFHENIIQLLETFEDETNIFEVLELCDGGELFDRMAADGGVPERHAARLMQQLAAAVQYCHTMSICHRSIQPENFLLKDSLELSMATVKLIDFSTAKEFSPTNPLKTKVCTLHYVAPEILTKKENVYTEKVDVWSLGVVFFVMLCGSPPFSGDTDLAVLKKIRKGSYKFSPEALWNKISKEGKDLVSKMLVVDVDSRYSSEDVSKHPWLHEEMRGRPSRAQNHLTSGVLNNLRNFHARNRATKAVLRVRTQIVSDEGMDEIRSIITGLDSEGTGHVVIADFREALRKSVKLVENVEELVRALWAVERASSTASLEQFMEAMAKRHKAGMKEATRAIFEVFDFDGSGTMTADELVKALNGGSEAAAFKAGIETVFGMSAADFESRFDPDPDIEYEFEHFMEALKPR